MRDSDHCARPRPVCALREFFTSVADSSRTSHRRIRSAPIRSPYDRAMPELCRLAPARLVILLAVLLGGLLALLPTSPAAAEDAPAGEPVQLVIGTAGRRWEGMSALETQIGRAHV